METEDLINLPASSNSDHQSENDDLHNSYCEPSDADSQPSNLEVKKDNLNGMTSGTADADAGNGDNSQLSLAADMDGDLEGSSSILQASVELNVTAAVPEDMKIFVSGIQTENGCVTARDGSPISNRKRDGSPISNREIDENSISGVKKAKTRVDELQPSVHVMYNSLSRESKRKLEELLQQWSEWHAQHCSSHVRDSNEVLESGEETYFPALRVGLDNSSAVSFWMDNQTRNQQSREFIGLDSKSVPLYDRGYSLEGGSEITDASRCFNCGSYGHSLKECPKPRDNLAVNNARKQHKSRRNQKTSSRNPTRYYQNSPGGKYDGLKPGVLGAETRQILGLGEFDPPPWLNRMREIGYPPGYLDPEDWDQPSGITIFADEESKEEKEDGEILEVDHPELPRKMSVEFPGINAPIPENADEKRWAPPGPSSSNLSRNRSQRRSNYSSEPSSSDHYHESRDFRDEGPPQSHEQRRHRDFRDDEGPPGCDHPGFSPSLFGRYSERHGGYDSPQSARGNISIPRSPSLGGTLSDRGRWSPSVHEVSPNPGSYGSAPAQYSPQNRLYSPHNYSSTSYENRGYDRWDGFNSEFSSRRRDKHDKDYHRSRR